MPLLHTLQLSRRCGEFAVALPSVLICFVTCYDILLEVLELRLAILLIKLNFNS